VRVATDSNILVRANPRARGPASRLLLLLASKPGSLIISRTILDEVGRALAYPRLLKRFQLPPAEIADFLDYLVQVGELVVPASIPEDLLRDPNDRHVLGTAIAGKASVLCTRDLDLLQEQVRIFAAKHEIEIMTDLDLLAILDKGES